MKARLAIHSLGIGFIAISAIQAQSPSPSSAGNAVTVTPDNFTRTETDTYFANIVKEAGGPGKFFHRRELELIDKQIVIRGNRDIFRLYGPEKPLFDRTWKLPDVQEVK